MVTKSNSSSKTSSKAVVQSLPLQLSNLSIQETETANEATFGLRSGSTKKKTPKIVTRWNEYFGAESELENWQMLCRDLGVNPVPTSLTQCRKVLKEGIWVNIHDFLNNKRDGKPQKLYDTEKELAKYTMRTRKIYPKNAAKEGGPIRDLLAHIFGK